MAHATKLGCALLLSAALACLAAGCGTSPPSQFYVLQAPADLAAERQGSKELSLVVGPVELAEYLNRPQMVTRQSDHELKLSEYHRWAEPLEDNVTRVLVESLSLLLATNRVVDFPSRGTQEIDFHVCVEILRFDAGPDASVNLDARWQVFKGEWEVLLESRGSRIRESAAGTEYGAIVAAQNRALVTLSREIADALRAVSP